MSRGAWRTSAVSAHLADLGAEEVSRLRHEGTYVGGVAPTDYERPSTAAVGLFCDKLKRLVKLGGKDLVVSESPALGGFGHRVHGDLYNLDTLKHLEVLIALRRGGLLDEMMRAEERRLVVQVGPGWGGFAIAAQDAVPTPHPGAPLSAGEPALVGGLSDATLPRCPLRVSWTG